MSIFKKLFSGSALQTINLILDIGIGFFMMPFLITGLGEQSYGLWLLIGSIISYLGLLTVGLGTAVGRYLSTENHPETRTQYQQTFNTALIFYSVASIIAIGATSLIAFLPNNFSIEPELTTAFQSLMLIMSFNVAMSFISAPFSASLYADYKFAITSGAELILIIVKTTLTVYLISNQYGVVAVGAATLVATVVSKLFIIIYAIFGIKKITINPKYVKFDKLKQLLKFSAKTFLAWLGDILRFSIDNVVITTFVGLSAVTVYNIPLRLFNYASQFIITTLSVLQPFFSRLAGEENADEIKQKFELAYGVSFGLGAIFAAGLFVFGYDFISLWVGHYEEVKLLMYIFPIMILLATSQNPCLLILYSRNKHQYYAYQNIGEGAVNAIISIIAVQYWGIIGVAMGSLIPQLVTKIFLQPKLTCNIIQFSLLQYYKQMFESYLFVLIACIIAINLKSDISNWTSLAINIVVFSVVFIPSYWFLALNKNTKAFFITKLKRK